MPNDNNSVLGIKRGVVQGYDTEAGPNFVIVNLVDYYDMQVTAPVLAGFAGKDHGIVAIPEKGDEVILAFISGDIRLPVIIGSVFNSTNQAQFVIGNDGKNETISIQFTAGTKIEISNTPDKQKFTLTTKKGHSVTLDDDGEKAQIVNKAGDTSLTIDLKGGNIEAKAKQKVSITAGQDTMVLENGKGLAVTSNAGDCKINTNNIAMKAQAQFSAEGSASASVKGNAQLTLEASGPTQIKGALIQLN